MPEPARPKEPKPVLPPPRPTRADDGLPAYAELHCRSNFSFLTGASHPGELVARAAELGYAAIAITDECSVAGIVRAHEEVKRQKAAAEAAMKAMGLPPQHARCIQLIVGSVFDVTGDGDTPGCRLVLLARNRAGYGDIGELITLARLRCAKGTYRLTVRDLDAPPADPDLDYLRGQRGLPDCHALLIPRRTDDDATLLAQARWLQATFVHAAVAVELLLWADDAPHAARLEAVAAATGLPLAAAGAVLMHQRARKPLQDTLTAIRLKTPVADCGFALAPNAEQHLRPRARLARLYRAEWLAESVRIARGCRFALDELAYRYPDELVPKGLTAIDHLRALTEKGAALRYPGGVPDKVRGYIAKEMRLIEELQYEAFFLTVEDIVREARRLGILCQGRGSAANSAVCYCLGITAVPPEASSPLFERFISKERGEPPDIDVDFEHERREEVIQYIYRKYGHHRTALAAALATYRRRGAVRDVGKALGFDAQQVDAFARAFQWFDDHSRQQQALQEAGLDADAAPVQRWVALVGQLRGFPRHLSQHVGGFVIADHKLARLVPIETAAMDNRRVIQWDKDDLESLGLLKVDVLARAIDHARAAHPEAPVLAMTPRGKPLSQVRVRELAAGPGVIVLCGRFEGFDERIFEGRGVEEVSVGDIVLSGGEPAAIMLLDACIRLLPGVMGAPSSGTEESFENGLLEYPHYTRPAEWEGRTIPEVLRSGDHAKIAAWRKRQSEVDTRSRRPDLWELHEGARVQPASGARREKKD